MPNFVLLAAKVWELSRKHRSEVVEPPPPHSQWRVNIDVGDYTNSNIEKAGGLKGTQEVLTTFDCAIKMHCKEQTSL